MFAGLIFAREEAADLPGGLVATLPFAGATVVETQLRRLRDAGATRCFVVAGRVTADLTAALERLRRGGLQVELTRKPGEIADSLRPDEPVLALADGVVVDHEVLETLGRAGSPTLLAIADAPADTPLERIDPRDHWAGVALVDTALLERTLSGLGEWDLQSTLLRRAAQAGAARRYLAPDATVAQHVVIATRAQAATADVARMRDVIEGQGRIAERGVARWIGQPLTALARRNDVPRSLIGMAAGVLGLIGLAAAAAGWLAGGMLVTVAAAIGFATARIAAWHAFDEGAARTIGWVGDVLALLAIIAVALGSSRDGATLPLALTIATLTALILAHRARGNGWRWAPTPVTVVALLFVASAFAFPVAGIVLVAGHATASLALAIERLRVAEHG